MLDEYTARDIKGKGKLVQSHFLAYFDTDRELDAQIAVKFFGWRWVREKIQTNTVRRMTVLGEDSKFKINKSDTLISLHPVNTPGWLVYNIPSDPKLLDDVTDEYLKDSSKFERFIDWGQSGTPNIQNFCNLAKLLEGVPKYSSNAGCAIVLAELARLGYAIELHGNPVSGYKFVIHVVSSDPSWDPVTEVAFSKFEEYGQAVCKAALKVKTR